jgi:acyl-CoA thioesterase I
MAATRDAPADRADRRVLFFGDSFVAGTGDPAGLGWVGRVVASSFAAGAGLTAYNLGVRGETSVQVAARWRAEARPRMLAPAGYGVVFSVGVNDTMLQDGRRRVEPRLALDSLGSVLDEAAAAGLRAFLVGPAPAGEAAHDARIGGLSASFERLAAGRGVPFVAVSRRCANPRNGSATSPAATESTRAPQGTRLLRGSFWGVGGWNGCVGSQPDYSLSRTSQHPDEAW